MPLETLVRQETDRLMPGADERDQPWLCGGRGWGGAVKVGFQEEMSSPFQFFFIRGRVISSSHKFSLQCLGPPVNSDNTLAGDKGEQLVRLNCLLGSWGHAQVGDGQSKLRILGGGSNSYSLEPGEASVDTPDPAFPRNNLSI